MRPLGMAAGLPPSRRGPEEIRPLDEPSPAGPASDELRPHRSAPLTADGGRELGESLEPGQDLAGRGGGQPKEDALDPELRIPVQHGAFLGAAEDGDRRMRSPRLVGEATELR